MNKSISYISLLFLFLSCNGKDEGKTLFSPVVISISDLQQERINLSDIADTILYYPLEFTENFSKRGGYSALLTDSLLCVFIRGMSYVYNINEYSLSHSIGEEIKDIHATPTYDIQSNSFPKVNSEGKMLGAGNYLKGNRRFHFINLYDIKTGHRLDSIPIETAHVGNYAFFNDTIIAAFTFKKHLMLLDLKGNLIKKYEELDYNSGFNSLTSYFPDYYMGHQDSLFYFFHNWDNTVYGINRNFALYPVYTFDLGNRGLSINQKSLYKNVHNLSKVSNDYYCLENFLQTDRFIFMGLVHKDEYHYIVYDKRNKKGNIFFACPVITDYDPINDTFEKLPELYSINNDFDGGLPFWPRNVTREGDLFMVWNSEDLKRQIESEDIDRLKSQSAYNNLKNMLLNLPEEGCLVAILVKVKK